MHDVIFVLKRERRAIARVPLVPHTPHTSITMLGKVKGFLFFFPLSLILYLGGIFFLPPFLLLLLLPWGAQLSDTATCFVASLFFKLAPAILEVVFGVKVRICGDGKKLEGPCLLIMNHRTRFDWMFLWCYLIRMGDLRKLKIVLKDSLKAVPVLGWALQSMRCIFISRKWVVDEKLIKEGIEYYIDSGLPVQLLVFPEGTDLSPSNKEKGHRYAEDNGMQKYEYVLHPRTKGFSLCMQEFRKFKGPPPTLVNISVGYLGEMPQNERDISAGRWPSEIHFFAEQHPFTSLPTSEEGLTKWLQECWKKKELQLESFYKKQKFSASYVGDSFVKESYSELKKVIFLWTLFCSYLIYNFLTNWFYWYYFPLWTTFYLLVNHCTKGIDVIFQKRHRLFMKWWKNWKFSN